LYPAVPKTISVPTIQERELILAAYGSVGTPEKSVRKSATTTMCGMVLINSDEGPTPNLRARILERVEDCTQTR
jgi:hypothetical protein